MKLLIESISLGQHNLGLYFNGRQKYASVVGGLTSILLVVILIAYAALVLVGIFMHEWYYTVTTQTSLADDSTILSKTIGDYYTNYQMTLVIDSLDALDCQIP